MNMTKPKASEITNASTNWRWKILEWPLAVLCVLVALTMLLQCYFTLRNFGLDQPFQDQYGTYLPYLADGFPSNVLQPENGHRPIIPATVRVAEIAYFHSDQRLQTFVGTLFCLSTFALLLVLCLHRQALSLLCASTVFLLITIALFWLGNVRMLIHANEQMHVYGVLWGLAAALGLMWRYREKPTWLGFGLLICAAFFSTFCFGNGLIVFPTLVALALLLRWPWRWQVAMTAATLFAALLYTKILPGGAVNQFPGASKLLPGMSTALTWLNAALDAAWLRYASWDIARIDYLASVTQSQGFVAKFAVAVIGNEAPLDDSLKIANRLGIATALIVLAILVRHLIIGVRSRLQLIALGLMIFCLGTAMLITLFRIDYFMSEAASQVFADRYVPWSCMWYLGLALYVIDGLNAKRVATIGMASATLLLAWCLNWSQVTNAVWARFAFDALQTSSMGLLTNTLPEERLGSVSTQTREKTTTVLAAMRAHQLAYFYPEARIDALLNNAQLAPFTLTQFAVETPYAETPIPVAGNFTAKLSDVNAGKHLRRLRGYGPNQNICAVAWPAYANELPIRPQALGLLEKSVIRGLSLCATPLDQLQWYALEGDARLWQLQR